MLHSRVDVALYLPADLPAPAGGAARGVLTLLHGYTNSGDDWLQMSAAARYAAGQRPALVCPSPEFVLSGHGARPRMENVCDRGACRSVCRPCSACPRSARATGLPGSRWAATARCIWGSRGRTSMPGAPLFGRGGPCPHAGPCRRAGRARDLRAGVRRGACTCPKQATSWRWHGAQGCCWRTAQPKILLTNGLEDTEVYEIRQQNDTVHAVLRTLPLAHYRRMQWPGVHEWNFLGPQSCLCHRLFSGKRLCRAQNLSDWNTQPLVEETCAAPAQA